MAINVLKKIYIFYLIILGIASFTHSETPTIILKSSIAFQQQQPNSHIRHGIRPGNNTSSSYTCPSTYNIPACYDNYNWSHYASLSAADFQQVFQQISDNSKILNNYPLYAFPNFLAFARTLPGYDNYILALHDYIQHDKTFHKQTACMPYFTYSTFLWHENSGFHNFVSSEAQNIIKTHQNTSSTAARQGTLSLNNSHNLDVLVNNCIQKINAMPQNNTSTRLAERVNAINETRNHNGKCFNYAAQVTHVNSDDPDAKIFQNNYGTHLDRQLHKELCQTRNTMRHLERTHSNDPYVQILAPVVYRYTTQAKNEHCPLTAFELADFCHTITQVLTNGMHIIYDASSAIGTGALKGAYEFTNIEHWKGMATGAAQLGLLFINELVQEEMLDYAVAFSMASHDSDVLLKAANKYCEYTQAQKDVINVCVQETYKKIKAMSWQEILENGAEIGTTMILDTLALNAINGFSHATSNLVIKQLNGAMESGVLFTEQYAVEVAGFGKLIVEEGVEVSTKAADIIKNDLVLFTQNNNSISHLVPGLENIANNIHKNFEQLIKSANTIIKGNNTAAGRAFQKHATREGSAFVGEITGNTIKNTEQAISYINKIIKSPESTFLVRDTKAYGEVLDIRLPDGMGARWTSDGKTFIGFLEKYTIQQ